MVRLCQSWTPNLSTQPPEDRLAAAKALRTYPKNPMVKYIHAPSSRHMLKFAALRLLITPKANATAESASPYW